jgi:RNA recognition motif-containing protein
MSGFCMLTACGVDAGIIITSNDMQPWSRRSELLHQACPISKDKNFCASLINLLLVRSTLSLSLHPQPRIAVLNRSKMSTKLYVSSLSPSTDEDSLRNAFGSYGDITEVVRSLLVP